MKQFMNTLYITTPEAYLRLEGETVCVMVEKEKRLQVPLHHLSSFVLFDHVMLSPALMGRCAADGRSIVWLNRSGRFQARMEGPVNGNILLRQAQFRAGDDEGQILRLSQRFIAGKIRNSRQVLMRGARDSKDEQEKTALVQAARSLANNLKKLANVQNPDEARGLEGDAARIYFDALPLLIRESARTTFVFTTRNRRPPRDCFNALISFLYALVLGDCRSALETVGLDPQLGFLHAVRPGRESLALDLLEEFRAPLCDRLALTVINREQIKDKDFGRRDGGSVLLNDTGRKTVIAAYQARKQEELIHPVLGQSVSIGLIPQIQARLLARYLRGDVEDYVPYLQQ
jgi:CRISPR-associated protein Cas1